MPSKRSGDGFDDVYAGGQDRSNGWEAVAGAFTRDSRRSTVGVSTVQAWVTRLPPRPVVLDLGCGAGSPRSEVLNREGFTVCAVDASPSLANAYRSRFPSARVAHEPVEESPLFHETFDGVLAWGLLFLLPADAQRNVIHRIAHALRSGGGFLFTAPARACRWTDLSTRRPSLSLGANAYRAILAEAGLELVGEHHDEGENHYYEAGNP